MFDAVEASLPGEPSFDSLTSTPLEFSGVVGGVIAQPEELSNSTATPFQCPECPSVLKTKSTFARHTLLHKLNGTVLQGSHLKKNIVYFIFL